MKNEEFYLNEKLGFMTNEMKHQKVLEDLKENLEVDDKKYLRAYAERFVKPSLDQNVYFIDKEKNIKKVFLFPWQKMLLVNFFEKSKFNSKINKTAGLKNIYLVTEKEDIEFLLDDLKPKFKEEGKSLDFFFKEAVLNTYLDTLDTTHLTPVVLSEYAPFESRCILGMIKDDWITTSEFDGTPVLKTDLYADASKFKLCPTNFIDWEKYITEKQNEVESSKVEKTSDIFLKVNLNKIENENGFNYIKVENENNIEFVKINENNFRVIGGEYCLQSKSNYSYSVYDETKSKFKYKITIEDLKNKLYANKEKIRN